MYFLGFSFTEHNDGYATNFTTVGEQLFEALIQFYTMFPEQQPNPFYIIAESYGGKIHVQLNLFKNKFTWNIILNTILI